MEHNGTTAYAEKCRSLVVSDHPGRCTCASLGYHPTRNEERVSQTERVLHDIMTLLRLVFVTKMSSQVLETVWYLGRVSTVTIELMDKVVVSEQEGAESRKCHVFLVCGLL